MKLFIINENGMQEFIPANQTTQNKENTFTFFNELKDSILKSQQPKKSEINLFTISKLVSVFETTRPTIYSWIDLGLLKPIKLGGRVYFNQADIEKLIEEKSISNQ